MMTVTDLRQQITDLMGVPVRRLSALHGESVAEAYRAVLSDGQQLAIKVERGEQAALHVEGNMLRYLAANSALPVPAVLYSSAELLIMQHLQGASHFSAAAERNAAKHLTALHTISAPQFGFESPTRIGGLAQPNPLSNSWVNFFAEQRLLHRAHAARDARQLPTALLHRLERFAADLPRWLDEPPHPALIHGDVWTTNVLAAGRQIMGFIDPAIYYADPEIELAFITLFNTFGDPFFIAIMNCAPFNRVSLKNAVTSTTSIRCLCMFIYSAAVMWRVWRRRSSDLDIDRRFITSPNVNPDARLRFVCPSACWHNP